MDRSLSTAIVLAGGLGTRLKTVVPDQPKPMAKVAGRPFLEHLLYYWQTQGIKQFILSVGYRHDQIQDHFGSSFNDCPLYYIEEQDQLGTGGALLHCQRQLQLTRPFLLLNGDTYFAVAAEDLANLANQNQADWCFSLFPSNNIDRYLATSYDNASGRISFDSKASKLEANTVKWVNGGVYWIHPKALSPFNDYFGKLSLEDELIPKCACLGQVFCGLNSNSQFIDIGVPEDYHRAQAFPFSRNSAIKTNASS